VLLPVLTSGARAWDAHLSGLAIHALLALVAVMAVAVQAAHDGANGLSDGLRTTPVPDVYIYASRLAVVPLLYLLELVVLAIASSVFAAIS